MLRLPNKSPLVWQRFFNENKPLVYRFIVKEIRKGIQQNLPKIVLFRFDGTETDTTIESKNYLQMLQDAMKLFVTNEDYEYAQYTKKVLDEYYIDKLIKESNGV